MDEKALIFGVSYAVDDLIIALLTKKICLNVKEDYYVNISPPPIPDSPEFDDAIISGIFVDLTEELVKTCLLYTSPSPRDRQRSRMPSSA